MFGAASAVTDLGGGRFSFEVDPSWFQGKGAFGGLTAAVAARAMASVARGRPLRTMSIHFCAPVPAGVSEIEVQLQRTGLAMSFVAARVLRGSDVFATAIAAFGADRSRDLDFRDMPMPSTAPMTDPERQLMADPPPSPPFPAFLQHFRMSFALGSAPYASAADAHVGVWVRPRLPEPLDAPLALALLDAPPPALLTKAKPVRLMSSVSISYHLLADLPDPSLDPSFPMLVDVHSHATSGGYSDQEGRLFSPDGRCFAVARQLVAVL